MYELAMAYKEGRGVVKSDTLASEWMLSAAKHSLPKAQFTYGCWLEDGLNNVW